MTQNNTNINEIPLPEHPNIVVVDWEAIETEIGEEVPEEARDIIESTGSEYDLDQWGYSSLQSVKLFTAIEENSKFKLPDGTILDPEIASLRSLKIRGYLRKYLGVDLNIPELCEDREDDTDFVSGLKDLYNTTEKLREHREEWEHGHPTLSSGSYGPDMLGNIYIHLKHTDESVLRNLPIEDLPVTSEKIKVFRKRSEPDMYTVSLRHERYTLSEEEKEEQETGIPKKHAEKADEIGLLGSNLSERRSTPAALTELEMPFEEKGTITVRGFKVYLIQYTKEGDERWVAEWSNRIAIDDVVFDSLIFDHKPTTEDVSQGALIVEAGLTD